MELVESKFKKFSFRLKVFLGIEKQVVQKITQISFGGITAIIITCPLTDFQIFKGIIGQLWCQINQ